MTDQDLNAAIRRTRFEHGQPLEQDRGTLGRLIDYDHSEFETKLYEETLDPQNLLIDQAQRREGRQWRLWNGRRRLRAPRA